MQLLRLPPPPWHPILKPHELQRGLAFYGSGCRIEKVAAKLLADQPIKGFTIGGSVTHGAGASSEATNYASLFFRFLNTTFPHRGHLLSNKGIGGTTSGIFSLCAEALIPPDADLVVAEFTFNEPGDQPFTSPQRRAFEQLLRKLVGLPGRPAVIVLHHYAWWFCVGDGVDSGLYYRPAEQQFTTMAQYYDMPSPSVRTAVWPMMAADVAPFKVSHVLKPNQVSPRGVNIPVAPPGTEGEYFFYDKVHPSDVGHQVMAELLAGVLMKAAESVAAAGSLSAYLGGPALADRLSSGNSSSMTNVVREIDTRSNGRGNTESNNQHSVGSGGSGDSSISSRGVGTNHSGNGSSSCESSVDKPGLPPPMIPGNADVPTSVCAMQEAFKALGREMKGFEYRPERPNGTSLLDQKWGYSGLAIGDWIVLELSTADDSKQAGKWATLYLGYLRSYEDMGVAKVACEGGCSCKKSMIDGGWKQKVSLTQIHKVQVTQHPKCRVKVTIIKRSSSSNTGSGSSIGEGGQGRSKFQLTSAMVSHFPLVLDNRIAGRAGGLAENG